MRLVDEIQKVLGLNLHSDVETQALLTGLHGIEHVESLAELEGLRFRLIELLLRFLDYNEYLINYGLPGLIVVFDIETGKEATEDEVAEIERRQTADTNFDLQSLTLEMVKFYEYMQQSNGIDEQVVSDIAGLLTTHLEEIHPDTSEGKVAEYLTTLLQLLQSPEIADSTKQVVLESMRRVLRSEDLTFGRSGERILRVYAHLLQNFDIQIISEYLDFLGRIVGSGGLEVFHFVPFFEKYFDTLLQNNLLMPSKTFLVRHDYHNLARSAYGRVCNAMVEGDDELRDPKAFLAQLEATYAEILRG